MSLHCFPTLSLLSSLCHILSLSWCHYIYLSVFPLARVLGCFYSTHSPTIFITQRTNTTTSLCLSFSLSPFLALSVIPLSNSLSKWGCSYIQAFRPFSQCSVGIRVGLWKIIWKSMYAVNYAENYNVFSSECKFSNLNFSQSSWLSLWFVTEITLW